MHGARVLAVRGELRRDARGSPRAGPAWHARARQLAQPEPPRRAEDGGVRDRRAARRRPGRVRDPVRRRRQHVVLRAGARRARRSTRRSSLPRRQTASTRSPRRSGSASRPTETRCVARGRCVVSVDDAEILEAWDELARVEGIFCEPSSAAGLAAVRRGDVPGERRRGHAHRARAQGHRDRRPPRAAAAARRSRPRRDRKGHRVIVRAPATSANLGPGFDCVGVALDLWNELEVTDGARRRGGRRRRRTSSPPTRRTSACRAYARLGDPAGKRFRFVNRIPLERGLGLVRRGDRARPGRRGAGRRRRTSCSPPRRARGSRRQPGRRARRGRDARPAKAASRASPTRLPLQPVAIVPAATVQHGALASRAAGSPSHTQTPPQRPATPPCSGPRSPAGDAELFARALVDRLHEPYRPSAVLDAVRADPPAGARGATLSGSGPTVIVWADEPARCAAALRERFADARRARAAGDAARRPDAWSARMTVRLVDCRPRD